VDFTPLCVFISWPSGLKHGVNFSVDIKVWKEYANGFIMQYIYVTRTRLHPEHFGPEGVVKMLMQSMLCSTVSL